MKEILKILENDSRITPEEISAMTGKPVNEVKEIIARAEKEGIIVKYKTIVNWFKSGVEEVFAMIEVKVQPQREVGFEAIAERIYRFPEVYSVYLVSGTYDLAVIVVGKTMYDIAAFVTNKLSPMESVQSVASHFLLKKYKEDGVILENAESIHRLPVSP